MFTLIAKPFGWLLLRLYEFVGNYGMAVILFALIVKLILLPFQMKSKRSMMQTSRLQPRLKELEKKHGANKAKYNEEVAKLYKEEHIHPMSGCLWTLIPFPILIALYQAIRNPITIMMGVASDLLAEGGAIHNMLQQLGFSTTYSATYEQIAQSQFITSHFSSFSSISDKLSQIDYSFLGLDLGAEPKWNALWTTDWSNSSVWLPALGLFLIPIISAALSFLSSMISMKMNDTGDPQQNSMKSMMYFMPLISLYIAFIMPAALGIYWIASTLFSIIQDIWLTKRYKRIMDKEDAIRLERARLRDAELESKKKETERLKADNATKVNPNTSKRKLQASARQEQFEKSTEWEKKSKPVKDVTEDQPASAVGTRRYAHGRAYDPDRYGKSSDDDSSAENTQIQDDNDTTPKTDVDSLDISEDVNNDMDMAEENDSIESDDIFEETENADDISPDDENAKSVPDEEE